EQQQQDNQHHHDIHRALLFWISGEPTRQFLLTRVTDADTPSPRLPSRYRVTRSSDCPGVHTHQGGNAGLLVSGHFSHLPTPSVQWWRVTIAPSNVRVPGPPVM